jgi:hypothetical protein
MMKSLSHDRNGTNIFASRTQKNLEHIENSAMNCVDVHPVTQGILALLGIVVFPWATSAFDIVKKQKLPLLNANGWPKWKMSGARRIIELGDLIEVLRHAIAHGNIEFDSDSTLTLHKFRVSDSSSGVTQSTEIMQQRGSDRVIEAES